MAHFNTPDERRFIDQAFPYCPSISIDFGVMEKADNVLVMPVDFGWADLGTWGSLYELAEKDDAGNASLKTRTIFYEAERNIVTTDNPQKLVVVQGISDCIVAESGNVLLICRAEEEQRIKHFVADAALKYDKEYN